MNTPQIGKITLWFKVVWRILTSKLLLVLMSLGTMFHLTYVSYVNGEGTISIFVSCFFAMLFTFMHYVESMNWPSFAGLCGVCLTPFVWFSGFFSFTDPTEKDPYRQVYVIDGKPLTSGSTWIFPLAGRVNAHGIRQPVKINAQAFTADGVHIAANVWFIGRISKDSQMWIKFEERKKNLLKQSSLRSRQW